MNSRDRKRGITQFRNLVFVAWLLLALPSTAAAQQAVGRVLSAVGEVVAVREHDSERTLNRGDEIFIGETIITGERGRVQIRFVDDGLVDLRPETNFEIEEYREPAEDEGGSAVMNFLQGAMRTISGRIGEDEEDEYRMGSPVATVGIRGTDYSLQFCDANCADLGRDEGLYGRVDEGAVEVTNEAGTGEFSEGDYFYVADESTQPQRSIAPPTGILDGNDDGDTEEEDEDDGEVEEADEAAAIREDDDDDADTVVEIDDDGDDLIGTNFVAGDDNPEPERDEAALERVMVGGMLEYGGIFKGGLVRQFEGDTNLTVDDNAIIEAEFDDGVAVLEVSNLQDAGNYSGDDFDVYWGRWTEGRWLDSDGNETTVSEGGFGGFSFMYSDDITTQAQLSNLSGTATFSNPVGPAILSEASNSWFMTSTLGVDFDASTIEFDILLFAESPSGFSSLCGDVEISAGLSEISVDSLASIDAQDLSGTWDDTGSATSGNIEGALELQFVGSTADGAMIVFVLDAVDEFEHLVGTTLLTR